MVDYVKGYFMALFYQIPHNKLPYVKIICLFVGVLSLGYQSFSQLTASFSPSKNGDCKPAHIQFTNTTRGASANAIYQWDFGNGNSSTLANPAATYDEEKEYTVTLTVIDGGLQSTARATITVYKTPVVDFSVAKNKFCLPEAASFVPKINPGNGNVDKLTWDFGDGSTGFSFGEGTMEHSYSKPILATVTLTASNSFGCYATVQKRNVVRVLEEVIPIFTADKEFVCKSFEKVKFTNESKGPGTLTYLWDFGDGTTSAEKEPVHVFNKSGAFKVILKVISDQGCSQTSTPTTINVENFVTNFSVPNLLCERDFQTLSNISSPVPTTTNWTINDDFESISNNGGSIGYYFNEPKVYKVTMVNNFGTCVQTFTKDIVVKPKPSTQPFVGIQVGKCGAPDTLRFNDTTTGTVKWNWRLDAFGSNTRSVKSFDYPITQNGTYFISLMRTNAEGCTQDVNQVISVFQPWASIQIKSSTSSGFNRSCGPFSAAFKASGSDEIVQYNWVFSNGGSSADAEPEKAFTTEGTHTVTLNYKLANGCTGATATQIIVDGMPKPDFTHEIGPTICGSNITQIRNTTVGSFTGFLWNFDADNPASGYFSSSAGHNYREEGSYSVGLIAINGTCRDTLVKKDFFKVLPPFVRISEFTNTCEGTRGTVTFKHASVKGISGVWDFGDGTTAPFNQNQQTITHTYKATGSYTTTLTITNGGCTQNMGVGVNVLLKQNPVLSTDRRDACANETFGFTLTNIETNPTSVSFDAYFFNKWEYDNGKTFDGFFSRPWNQRWVNNTSGSLVSNNNVPANLRVIFTSAYFNCQDTSNFIPLTFKGANAGFEVVTHKQCYALPVVFRDTSKAVGTSEIVQRRWDFGDGQSLTTTRGGLIEHRYRNPGRFQVTLSVTDAGGCTVRTTSTSEVLVSGPKANFSMSGNRVPLNETVYFYNATQNGFNEFAEYEWDFGDGTKGTEYAPVHTYPVAGNYTIRLIATNPVTGCKDTAFQTLVVRPFNTAFQMKSSFVNSSNCPPVLVNFNNTSFGAVRVEWDFGDGTGSESYFASKIYHLPGKYIVRLKVFGFNGLEGIFEDSVIVGKTTAVFEARPLFGCTSQGIQFLAKPGNMGSYLWDFGDGVTFENDDSTTLHAYTTPGVYMPRLLASDTNGCTIAVNYPEKIVIDSLAISLAGLPSSICDSAWVALNPLVVSVGSTVDPNSYVYQWSITHNAQTQTYNRKEINFHFNKPGKYHLSFQVRSPYGCHKTLVDSLLVVQGVRAVITAPQAACVSSPVVISGATTQPANGVGWNWQLGNNQTSNLQHPPTQVYPQPGDYTLRLIASIGTCTDTAFHTLSIQPNPVILLSPGREAIACLGTGLNLSASGAATYLWSPGTGLNNVAIPNPIASPMQDIMYRVNAFSAIGCSSVDSIRIRVARPIQVQIAPNTAEICAGQTVALTASGVATYQWIGNTTGLSATNLPNPVANPMQSTVYRVVGRDGDGCFSDTAETEILVNPLPTINAGVDLQIAANAEVTLTTTASSNVSGYLWNPGTFLSCTTCPNPTVRPNTPISYVVKVNTAKGCEASDTIHITLLCGESFYIPTGFTPNTDNLNERFYVMGGGATIRHFRIFNRYGQLIFERKNTQVNDRTQGWDGRFNGQLQPAGAYAYRVVLECFDGKLFEYKGTVTLIR